MPNKHHTYYEVFKGYQLLASGNAKECADQLGIKVRSLYHIANNPYHRTVANAKNPDHYIIAFKV